MRRFAVKLILFTLLLIPILEISLRLFMPQQLVTEQDIYAPDTSGVGIRLASNLDKVVNTGERDVRLLTDDNGFRIGEDTEDACEVCILAVGDSYTVALQVPYEQTTTGRLETLLTEQLGETVRVVNTAQAAYGPDHYRIMTRNQLAKRDYDMVIVFVYVYNDLTTETAEYFYPFMPEEHPLRMPTALSKEEIIKAWLYPINNYLEQNSHLFVLMKNQGTTLLTKVGLSKRGFPSILLEGADEKPEWAFTANLLTGIEDEAAQFDVPVVYVLIPSVYQIDPRQVDWAVETLGIDPSQVILDQPNRLLGAEMAHYNLITFDMFDPLSAAYADGITDLYGSVDFHLSPEGHRVMAETLAPQIAALLDGD